MGLGGVSGKRLRPGTVSFTSQCRLWVCAEHGSAEERNDRLCRMPLAVKEDEDGDGDVGWVSKGCER